MTKRKKAKKVEIDANVQTLVAALNAMPGISTFSSCGGHAEQKD